MLADPMQHSELVVPYSILEYSLLMMDWKTVFLSLAAGAVVGGSISLIRIWHREAAERVRCERIGGEWGHRVRGLEDGLTLVSQCSSHGARGIIDRP